VVLQTSFIIFLHGYFCVRFALERKLRHRIVMSTAAYSEPSGSVVAKRQSFFRSVPFQIIVACAVSFTAPGMWDALGGLGAGGAAEPYAVSAANALVYGLFSVVCVAAGAINNRIGLKYGLALGAIGYPLYGAGLYTNNVSANTWFWAAEAAIIIGYPSPGDRAFFLAIWQSAKAAGPRYVFLNTIL
jgi:hypothetical protein